MSEKRSGQKFQHYTRGENDERFDHSDHLHVELSEDAAAGRLPFYASRLSGAASAAPAPPPARSVFGPPNVTSNAPAPTPNQSSSSTTNPARSALPGTATGPAPTTTTSNPPSTTPTVNAAATSNPERENKFQDLFRLYAQYEYLRQRYTVRQAAIQMRFNPYLVPGFPSMMFDSMRTRFHMVGYVQAVSHSAQAGGGGNISTSVQLTCCRTLPEFINDVRADSIRFSGRVMAAPAEIIKEIRQRIQDEDNAEAFYRRLFYGDGPRLDNVPTAFRWDQAMAYSVGLETQNIVNEGRSVAQQEAEAAQTTAQVNAANAATGPNSTAQTQAAAPGARAQIAASSPTVRQNLDPDRELSPRENVYQDAFDRYDVAMRLASRPACTLTQYIRFWHGGQTVEDLIQNNIVSGPQDTFSYAEVPEIDVIATGVSPSGQRQNIRGPSSRKSSVYYARIFKLRPGPGVGDNQLGEPSEAQRGYTNPPNVQPSPTHAGVPADYPQTRADWDQALEQYREKVRYLLRPST